MTKTPVLLLSDANQPCVMTFNGKPLIQCLSILDSFPNSICIGLSLPRYLLK